MSTVYRNLANGLLPGDAATYLQAQQSVRRALLAESEGLLVQSFPRQAAGLSNLMIAGTVYFAALPLLAGDLITNVCVIVTVGGVAVALSKVGLYDKLGNRLGLSTDQGTSWESTGAKEIPLITPYPVLSDDVYYAAAVSAAGTLPRLYTGAGTSGFGYVAFGGGTVPYAAQTGQIDLPASAVLGTGTICPWFGFN